MIDEMARSVQLDGAIVSYVLRRTPRARGVRLTIDDRRGLVVSIPPWQRRGWAHGTGESRAEAFIHERSTWVLRHLRALDRRQADVEALGGMDSLGDGSVLLYRGVPHRLAVLSAGPGERRSTVERIQGDYGDELYIRVAKADRRSVVRVLEAWFRDRAAEAIDAAVAAHAPALGVSASAIALRDPRTRWGSASKAGRLMFSWRLVLAPPDALQTVVVHELAHLRVFGHGPGFWKVVASRRPSHLADRTWLRRNSHVLHAMLAEAPPKRAKAG